jgi:sporulation integral membrane protein YtvI
MNINLRLNFKELFMNKKYVLDKRKILKFLLIFACIMLTIFLFFKSIKYLAPFFIAYIIAAMMEPLVRFITSKTKLSRKIVSAVTLVCVMALLGFIFFIAISRILIEIKELMHTTPYFITELYRNVDLINTGSSKFIIGLPVGLTKFIRSGIASSFNSMETMLNGIFKSIFSYAVSLPSALVFIIITILSTYFISSGRNDIKRNIKSKIPEDLYSDFSGMKSGVFSSLIKLMTAYMIIMGITFTELFIGLSILNVRYSIILAFLICLVDILPVLGTGTILMPWAVYELIIGNTKMGASIFFLYIVILIVRQIIEPKIVGHQIGVHPLISLMSVYVGLKLLGTVGLLLGPIIMIIIKNTYSILYQDKSIQEIFYKLGAEKAAKKVDP